MPCPSEETLVELVAAGTLPGNRRSDLEAHAAECERCRHALVALASHTARSPGTRPPPVPNGAQLGRYRVLELVGEGAMGRVYAAYDSVLDRRVALKLIHRSSPSRRTGPADRTPAPPLDPARGTAAPAPLDSARLLSEAQLLARVAHPNLVAVHDAGVLDGVVFIAMEFVTGATLGAWLRTPRPQSQILDAFLQAGRGLAAAHAAGLVHRDFKPENVLVGNDGRVRVSDFGLARDVNDAGDAGALVGTPRYMAPEQRAGQVATAQSDQFAFCTALAEALGRKTRALERGLSSEAAQRFPSMDALLRALQPKPPLWKRVTVAASAAAVLALATGWTFGRQRPAALCDGGTAQLQAVWNPPRAAQLAALFDGLGGAKTWQALDATLGAHATAWSAMHREACEATRVTGAQSDGVLAARMECLDRRLTELEAVTAVLATTDREGLANAPQAAQALTPVSVCANVAALLAPDRLPENPAQLERAKALHLVVAKARALREAGRYEEGLQMATHAAADAHALGHGPTEAQALLIRGELQDSAGDAAAAEGTLRDAYLAASTSRDERTLTAAATHLSFVVGQRLSRLDEGTQWAWLAAAGLKRVGADATLEARLANQEGHLLHDRADFAGAEAKYRAAYALMHQPAVLANVSRAVNSQGKFEEGMTLAREAARQLAATLGDGHPKVAQARNAVATTLINLGRHGEALAETDAALAVSVPTLGPAHVDVARIRLNRALALQHLERLAEAVDETQRALDAFRAAKMDFMVAESLLTLGETLGAEGKVDDALARLEEARAAYAKTVGDGHEQVSVVLEVRGDLLLDHGRPAEALADYQQALQRREKARGPDHPENCFALAGIGRAQAQLGKRALAVPALQRAAKMLEEGGFDAELLATTKAALAAVRRSPSRT